MKDKQQASFILSQKLDSIVKSFYIVLCTSVLNILYLAIHIKLLMNAIPFIDL